ncbi:DUF6292 family protein [Amycolatopsis benzoatilytica]|uniref:DUF6292 family protein n=1 Tax=Amycolatopsis benzoatilytica TaxID=346045 RepID=UPI00036755CE|nr:DUF6292 family protein [Amycolatopsis benzoatilytica]
MQSTEDRLRRGLRGYLTAVSAALGTGAESFAVDFGPPKAACLVLDIQLAGCPGRETALLWDERHGWSFAIESPDGDGQRVLAYLGGDLVPAPARLRAFVRAVRGRTGGPAAAPPRLRDRRVSCLAHYEDGRARQTRPPDYRKW